MGSSSTVRAAVVPPERSESLEKRTRFSLSHDEGSIGTQIHSKIIHVYEF